MTERKRPQDEDDLSPEDRRLARRIGELPDVDPPEGWEDRLLALWRARGSSRR